MFLFYVTSNFVDKILNAAFPNILSNVCNLLRKAVKINYAQLRKIILDRIHNRSIMCYNAFYIY